MKIAVVNEYVDETTGGATLYVVKVMRELIARGHRVALAHGRPDVMPPVEGLTAARAFAGVMGFNDRPRPAAEHELLDFIASVGPDLVYFHQIHCARLIAALAVRWPTVRFEHGIDLTCPTTRRMSRDMTFACGRRLLWRCQAVAYLRNCMPRNPVAGLRSLYHVKNRLRAHRLVCRIRVASRFVKDVLVLCGVPAETVRVLPYFTDTTPAVNRSVDWSRPEIMYSGRLVPEKGPHKLLEALRHVSTPVTLSMLGSGPSMDALRCFAAAQSWPHRVSFTQWVDNTKIGAWYDRAAVLVVPSLNLEGFGINGIEAMMHGVPAAAFDAGGIRDWLRHEETGLLVPRSDSAALGAAIQRLVSDRGLNERLGLRGRDIALSSYTAPVHMPRLEEIFAEAREVFGRRTRG